VFGELDHQPLEVAFEATFGWGWFADLLADAGISAHMAHPLAAKAISSARVKNDSVDAKTLAHLLRTNLLPEAWIAPPEAREARRLARMRTSLVRVRSQLRCQVHAVLAEHGVHAEVSDVFGKAGRALLEDLALPPVSRARLDANLRLIDAVSEEVAEAERELRALFRGDDRIKRLTAIPGVGLITAATVVTEVWDITRFPSADRLCSWAGLTPLGALQRRTHPARTHLQARVAMAAMGPGRGGCSSPSGPRSLSLRRPHRFAAWHQDRPGRARPAVADPVLLRPSRRTWLPGVPGGPMRIWIVVGALASRHGLNRRPPI
jgi:transposase